jgi:DNA-binding ferritin-like protein (Dps family)
MASIKHNFWSAVARSTTVSVSSILVYVLDLFSESEIDQLYVTVLVDKNVFRLQVPVDYPH